MTEQREDSYVGRLIAGRYAIVKKLNQGGMGAVYLAIQRPLDRPVALKVLLRSHLDDPLAARRFEKEARSVSRLTHPHVVTLYDFGSTEAGELYIAMEYLQGTSLRDLVLANRYISWDRALHIVRGTASALVAAHAAGIIHRDLKPENVMLVERSGDVDFPKVLDFGLAKSLEPDVRGPITQRDIIPGTPAYLSPERANGVADDPRSDLYALGAMFFELITGRPPFEGDSSIKVILRHIHEQPATPSKANREAAIPPAIDELILQLLEKHPDKRPRSAAELLEKLDALHRPRGWHVAAPGNVVRKGAADDDLRGFAAAVAELEGDELSFALEDQEPVPLVRRKTDPRMERPNFSQGGLSPAPQPQQNTYAIASKPMPAPVQIPGGSAPVNVDTVPPPTSSQSSSGEPPVMLLTKKKPPAAPPAQDTQEAALHLLVSPKRGGGHVTPVPSNVRIASIADVSSHLATAKTVREVAELCVAFLATRFDRCVVADMRGPVLLASSGIVEKNAFLPAVAKSSGMQEMLVRKDAYYGGAIATPDWLGFFRALGGSLPGALFVATLKREGSPAYLFYGDHKDPRLRSDVRDAVVLLREAANAFSVAAL